MTDKEKAAAERTDEQIDASNLRLYARLAKENQWADKVIHWNVFEQTLNAVADRLEAYARQRGTSLRRASK